MTSKLTIPGLYDTTYGYDAKGRLAAIKTNTRQTDFTYTPQGFLESITDPENHTTWYAYDAVGRMTSIARPDGSAIGFAYDKDGNMVVLATPTDVEHLFGYNKVNLNNVYQTPISGQYQYYYDRDRRLTRIHFPSGLQINNIYNTGRLTQIQTPEGNINFTYLCGTKVGSVTMGSEAITYGYDGSLVTSEALSGTLNQTLGYTYNADFNLTGFTYAGGTTSYTYDNDGLLTKAGAFTITRDAANGLPTAVAGGALSLTRAFNGYGEVNSEAFAVSSQNVTSWSLTRDNAGRIIEKTEAVGGVTSHYVYTYDPMGRLLSVVKDGVLVEQYQYNQNGTRIAEVNALRGIAGRSFTYSDEDHLLQAGSTTYQYDADGFLVTKTKGTDVTEYAYSSRGELLQVKLPDGRVIDYYHDPLGRRIAKAVNGTITEKYLWQGLTQLLAVYDGANNLLMRFEYADARMSVAMSRSGTTYYLTYDQVGSLRVVTNSAGSVIKRVDYDSFGNILNDSNPTFEIPFGFAGGLYDRDTGLVHFGFRDYDSDIGRWTAKDPIGFGGDDVDLYGYCINDPLNLIDPLGLRKLTQQEREKLVNTAKGWERTKYSSTTTKYNVGYEGAKATKGKGADCSGAVWAIYKEAGFPYRYRWSAEGMDSLCFQKATGSPEVGDVGWWQGHVAMYGGKDEKGRDMVYSARGSSDDKLFGLWPLKWFEDAKGKTTWYYYDVPD